MEYERGSLWTDFPEANWLTELSSKDLLRDPQSILIMKQLESGNAEDARQCPQPIDTYWFNTYGGLKKLKSQISRSRTDGKG